MNKSMAVKLIKAIDGLLVEIVKASKWMIIAARLRKQLLLESGKIQNDALLKALKKVEALNEKLTEAEIDIIVNDMSDILSEEAVKSLRSVITDTQLVSAKASYKDIGVNFQFNDVNKKVLGWLERDQMYWIGNHYDADLRAEMLKTGQEVLTQGITAANQTNLFKAAFQDQFKRDKAYWNGLSNHITTRAREMNRVDAYDLAEVTEVEIVAVMDHRTSEICKHLNGKVIQVSTLRKQRDKLMNASDPEAVKKISPFYSDAMTEKIVDNKKLPGNIGMPPYHFHCRTITVIH